MKKIIPLRDVGREVEIFSHIWTELTPKKGHSYWEWDDNKFYQWFGLLPETFKNKIILDAGCGQGQIIKYFFKFNPKKIVGVDLSDGIKTATVHFKDYPNITLIQDDLNNIPYHSYFDVVFSSGVIHHTPDPYKSFLSLIKYTKPNGIIAVWVYEKSNFIREYINILLRYFTKKLKIKNLYRFSYLLKFIRKVPILGKIISCFIKTFDDIEGYIDWYGCRYQYHLSEKEFKKWYIDNNISILKIVPNWNKPNIKNKFKLLLSQAIYGKNLGWFGIIGKKRQDI